jgi:PDZ domain
MKKLLLLFFLMISFFTTRAQDGFVFDKGVDKAVIPFQFIDNLVFISIKINGVELNLLLDSGVEETILFSLDDKKEVTFFNIEKITLKGLGNNDATEGLKSTNNLLSVAGLQSTNHVLYVVLDQEFNISSHVGIPVNGIIGFDFFKNNLVEINYSKKKIIIYKDLPKFRKKIQKKFTSLPITLEGSKPYIQGTIVQDGIEIPSKLLIDTGNSDALWVFGGITNSIKIPDKNFEDYLGKGLSGDIMGRRASINAFRIKGFEFKNPIVAFPDISFVSGFKLVSGRMGSLGGEVMRRFNAVFDYTNSTIFLKKNSQYKDLFSYNKSGIEVQHYGLQWVQETVKIDNVSTRDDSGAIKLITNDFKYKFVLKPIYEINNIRKNSPAMNCGLQKGDIIVSINGLEGYHYNLKRINDLLKSEDDKWIIIEIERNSQIIKFKFQLINEL